jgi:hypothetical protein
MVNYRWMESVLFLRHHNGKAWNRELSLRPWGLQNLLSRVVFLSAAVGRELDCGGWSMKGENHGHSRCTARSK